MSRLQRAIALCIAFFLTQCAGPRYPVQGISRSCRPYFVRGKRYVPQQHYSYDEIGLASWYGPGFHGLQKAQGEIYDQHAMTAAHKTLPLPTIVKVTNLTNGRSIVVLVDDRGPFGYKKRIIDLSVSAAKELGIHARGVEKVRVQALPKESHALSMYLREHGTRDGRDKKGRSWSDVYRQEIGCKRGFQDLTPVSLTVHLSNHQEFFQKPTKAKSQTKTGMKSSVRSPRKKRVR